MFAIGEASRQSGVGIETIRYYERRDRAQARTGIK
ncbi:MerR family DNA-binding transcriptional regulator [uncultured Ruegeria sp.]